MWNISPWVNNMHSLFHTSMPTALVISNAKMGLPQNDLPKIESALSKMSLRAEALTLPLTETKGTS